MNLSNKITISRILIMPIFMVGLEMNGVAWKTIAFICFWYACYSDWLDGMLARKHGWVTDFGKFMDPLADKIFMAAAFIAFVGDPRFRIPAWIVTLILGREFMITGFRTIALSKGVVLPAQKSGKYKAVVQLVAIGAITLLALIYEMEKADMFFISENINLVLSYIPIILTWIVMLITVLSGISYIYSNRELLQ